MTRKKRFLLGAASGAVLLAALGGAANAVIPVIDTASLTQLVQSVVDAEKAFALQLEQYATEVKTYLGDEFSWVTQASQYATQLQQFYTEGMMFLNFAHHPTLGAAMGMMNAAGLGNSLPFSPYAAMNLISGSSYSSGGFNQIGGLLNSLSGMANYSWSQNKVYTPTDGSWASQQVIANGNGISGGQGIALSAYGDLRMHEAVLPSLRQNLLTADTTKDALDATGQAAVETAWGVNQMAQAQQIATMAALQKDARAQRDEERLACELEMFRTGGGACPSGASAGSVLTGAGGPNGGDGEPVPVPPPPPQDATPNLVQADIPVPVPPPPPQQPPVQAPPALPPGVLMGTPINPATEGPQFPNPAVLPAR